MENLFKLDVHAAHEAISAMSNLDSYARKLLHQAVGAYSLHKAPTQRGWGAKEECILKLGALDRVRLVYGHFGSSVSVKNSVLIQYPGAQIPDPETEWIELQADGQKYYHRHSYGSVFEFDGYISAEQGNWLVVGDEKRAIKQPIAASINFDLFPPEDYWRAGWDTRWPSSAGPQFLTAADGQSLEERIAQVLRNPDQDLIDALE